MALNIDINRWFYQRKTQTLNGVIQQNHISTTNFNSMIIEFKQHYDNLNTSNRKNRTSRLVHNTFITSCLFFSKTSSVLLFIGDIRWNCMEVFKKYIQPEFFFWYLHFQRWIYSWFYHTSHLFTGFIMDPGLQLNSWANSRRLLRAPITLYFSGGCVSFSIWKFVVSFGTVVHHT